MDTPDPQALASPTTFELRRHLASRGLAAVTGDAPAPYRIELHDDRLVVPASQTNARRFEIPLDQLTGMRVAHELWRASVLTIEAGRRVFDFNLFGSARSDAAAAFIATTRERITAQPHGDLTLARMEAREAEVRTLLQYRAHAIWLTVPLLLAAYAVRQRYADELFDLDYFGSCARAWLTRGELYRLVTAAWLHANGWHIGGNLVAIVWLGRAVERALGAARLLIIMTAATLMASLGSTWLTFGHTIGASGVGMGLAAGFAVVAIMYRGELPRPIAKPWRWWVVFVLLLLPSPDGPGPTAIDHAAHAGGAFGGALAAYLLCVGRPLARIRMPDLRWLGVLMVVVHLAALTAMSWRIGHTEPVGELARLTDLVREKRLSADEANAVTWHIATKKGVAPEVLRGALVLAEAGATIAPDDPGLADTVATLHHRTGSDCRAAELEARALDAVAEAFDATGFATQLARFLAAMPNSTSGITIYASDRQVKVVFAESVAGLAASGVTLYAVAMRHGRIEGLIRLKLGAGPLERYVKVPPPTQSIWNAMSTPIAEDAEYGPMLIRSGCACKEGNGVLNVWAVEPDVLGWP